MHFSHVHTVMNTTQIGEEDAYMSSSGTHSALVTLGKQEEERCWTTIYSDTETILPYSSLFMPPMAASSCLLSLLKWQVMLSSLDAQSYCGCALSRLFVCLFVCVRGLFLWLILGLFLFHRKSKWLLFSTKLSAVDIFNTETMNWGIKCVLFSKK